MAKPPEEWLTQANYDMDTADYMFRGGRYMYTVFMCHLSLEKGLKALYSEKLRNEPPKTHNPARQLIRECNPSESCCLIINVTLPLVVFHRWF